MKRDLHKAVLVQLFALHKISQTQKVHAQDSLGDLGKDNDSYSVNWGSRTDHMLCNSNVNS